MWLASPAALTTLSTAPLPGEALGDWLPRQKGGLQPRNMGLGQMHQRKMGPGREGELVVRRVEGTGPRQWLGGSPQGL